MLPFLLCVCTLDPTRLARWARLLSSQGWPVKSADTLEELARLTEEARLGLILADLELLGPGRVAELKRRAPHFLWVVVGRGGAVEGAEATRALEEGAEDYIPAALDDRVLSAKLRAHLRRLLPSYAVLLEKVQDPGGSLRVDRSAWKVELRDGRGRWKSVAGLTPTEVRLLCYFLERADVALDRRAILEGVWQERAEEVQPETLDRHVESLRRKLGPAGKRIEAVYGVGYVFRGG